MIYDLGLSHISAAASREREMEIMSASPALYLSLLLNLFALSFPSFITSFFVVHISEVSLLLFPWGALKMGVSLFLCSGLIYLFLCCCCCFFFFYFLLLSPRPALRRWLRIRMQTHLGVCHVAIHPLSLQLSSLFHLPFAASSSIAHLCFFLMTHSSLSSTRTESGMCKGHGWVCYQVSSMSKRAAFMNRDVY